MKKIVSAPYIDQTARWVNGCESISSVMLLQAVGIPIDPDVFIERDLPHAPYWEQEGRLYGPCLLYTSSTLGLDLKRNKRLVRANDPVCTEYTPGRVHVEQCFLLQRNTCHDTLEAVSYTHLCRRRP